MCTVWWLPLLWPAHAEEGMEVRKDKGKSAMALKQEGRGFASILSFFSWEQEVVFNKGGLGEGL